MTKANLEYLVHHIFLPTKLPGGDDSSAENETLLIGFVLDSLVRFLGEGTSEDETAIKPCVAMIKGLQISKGAQGSLSANGAQEVLRQLSSEAPVALFHAAAQNGGVLVHKTITSVTFETFELSPANKAVMTTQGRLVRQFPANATEIPCPDFEDETFQSVFTKTLEKMSHQTVQETKNKVRKAKQEHDEDRETVDPRIVTDLLPSMLRGAGKQVSVPGICKNTREEVLWSNSKLPWRRSPVWLLIRVGLQLTMTRLARKDKGLYKEFMAFLMAQVLDVATKRGAASDVLHTMSTKVCRRLYKLYKLKHLCDGKWLQSIHQIASETSKCLARRWDRIRKREEKPLELNDLQESDMEDNTYFSLSSTEDFLTSIPERGKHMEFPKFNPIPRVRPLDGNNLPTVTACDEEYLPFRLAMIESWVATSLDTWLECHIGEEKSCGDLKRLIQSYHSVASCWYSSRPEGASRMLLTVGELWAAADKAAIHALPMLNDYEPEVPTEVWQALLLASMADMERLHRLEAHLLNRQRVARLMGRPSILRSYGQRRSFPVEYFSRSVEHQQLKAEIEDMASAQRQAKIEEMRRLKEEYETLMQKFNDGKCDGYSQEEYGITVWYHSHFCVRHGYLHRANNLRIQEHEWPLPENTLEAQATVFELAVPPVLSEWRDITLYLINDVLLSKPSSVYHPDPSYSLREYQPLDKFFRTGRSYRVHLVSQAKPNVVTHRRDKSIQYCTESDFGRQMLENLTKGVSHIQENWESYTALCSYTCERIVPCFLGLLEKCRKVSYRWLMTVLGRVQDTTNETQRREFLETALNIALICGDSFNVYDGFLRKILADSEQASMLVECSIIIYNNASLKSETETTLRDILFDRWKHTMYRVRAILTCYWFETTSRGHLQVHLNILTGELLVNGLPLTRLPKEYERHDDYERLFRSLILNVMPSNLPGMRFCTTQRFQGHTVHFGMQDQDLLVRLEANESYLDLIPSRTFQGMLPHSFVNDYAHWYHNKTGIIQLRSLKEPWTANPDDWCLARQDGGWKLSQGGRTFLFAPSSSMAQRIAGILSPLEAPLGLHMLYDAQESALEVRVPGLRLDFLLRAGESTIRSRQFRDMHIDPDQSVGTLVGFKSKLVLRSDQDPPTRMLIMPEGDVQFQKFSDHVTVNVAYGTAHRVQSYRIDDLLGRLIADTKLESKLYLAYMHALTSSCLPDPFLRRTGTEEALHILGSASVRAPCPLSRTAHDRLHLIAVLAPSRAFYPTYEKVMQRVDWSSKLSFLAQDDRLYTVTKEILGRSGEIGFLYPHRNIEPSELTHTTMGLVERAILRNSRQCVSGFGAEGFTIQHDVAYQPRERGNSDRAERATEMAFRAYNKRFTHHLYTLLSHEIPPREDMLYDSKWLNNPKTFLSSYWCQLHRAFQGDQTWLNKFELMVWIATVAYSAESDKQVTQALLLLALSASVSAIPLPSKGRYNLSHGCEMKTTELEAIAGEAALRYEQTPAARLGPRSDESGQQTLNRRHRECQSEKKKAVELFKGDLARQWPCDCPRAPWDGHVTAYINVSKAMGSVVKKWTNWYDNREFAAYLSKFVNGLGEVPVEGIITEPPSALPDIQPRSQSQGFLSIDDLFHHVPPYPTPVPGSLLEGLCQATSINPGPTARLSDVLDFLDRKTKLDYEHHYLRELPQSLASLKAHAGHELNGDRASTCAVIFQEHLKQCERRVKSIYESLMDAVNQNLKDVPEAIQRIIRDAGFRPRISPIFFLQQLRNSRWSQLSSAWQDAIAEYGLAITALQQAKRLIRFQNDPGAGHKGWNPHEHSECEIMIREVQQQIAQQMIQPPDNENSVMQLNMGEGKSSVIVPIVATALGDGSKLPQARQLYQMLTSKLAGLPFSRDIRMNESRAETIHQLTTKCMQEGGHLLSFQLMELECQLDNKNRVAEKMMEIRKFFDTSSRDVVDESDENFSVKFELIYTVGQQRPIDHSPDRWKVVQEILGLREFTQSLDFDDRHRGRVPKVRILRSDAEKAIFNRTGMDGFPIAHQSPTVRNAWDLSGEEIEASTINHMLLLRGLFAAGILAFAFVQKRWRTRTKLAVPFTAKDSPTPRSEFSHPDVVIVLTCLSYYYGGLDDEALFAAFDLLEWVKTTPTIPEAFKHLQGVNLKDHFQCISEIFPHIRYSKAAIDYYLCRMVFAKESREFPHKLSASGWDLGKKKLNPTTGFSGTNDSRYQLDLPEQKHTNALVPEYLLRPENAIALMPPEMKGAALDSKSLLDMVTNMASNTRVILDFTNLEFSKEWLKCYKGDEHTQAVIFFNDSDEIVVLDRSGKVEELQTSPFADQLDQCLVFLDEAHTRGTDLRLPANYQAAVTLGANLTKDRLVQGIFCAAHQSRVVFSIAKVPRSMHEDAKAWKRADCQELPSSHNITVSDVLCWAITETCQNMRREVPLWLTQGIRFCHQRSLWDEMEARSDWEDRSECAGQFKEDEAQPLDQRYHPQQAHPGISSLLDRIEPHAAAEFRKHCQEFGLTELRTSSLQEEQERELSPETEHERQVERPPPAEPEIHHLHEDVRNFVRNGVFSRSSSAFKPAFMALEHTSAAKNFDVSEFRNNVWTVKGSFGSNNYADSFQRSGEIANNRLLVISPYEAQNLLPDIETSRHVTLRLYSPWVNLGFGSLDHLNLYTIPQTRNRDTIPRGLVSQLNVDYVELCGSLGLAWKAADESITLGPDGFIPLGSTAGSSNNMSGLSKSPVGFLKVLMAKIRQEYELIGRTHIGRILDGVRLREEEWVEI
ncbi:hypothetical protein BKA56DRAFT_638451 [Ilyonectria sp. MPI-CAGE-AT-0026]|nr:hypothetical protein BKA56DRAFT_638451 [Ilyonectria sp. MPI-CAGE-AT-0026]